MGFSKVSYFSTSKPEELVKEHPMLFVGIQSKRFDSVTGHFDTQTLLDFVMTQLQFMVGLQNRHKDVQQALDQFHKVFHQSPMGNWHGKSYLHEMRNTVVKEHNC